MVGQIYEEINKNNIRSVMLKSKYEAYHYSFYTGLYLVRKKENLDLDDPGTNKQAEEIVIY